ERFLEQGDFAGARAVLEQSDPMDTIRLVMLSSLELMAGNVDAALEAAADAAQGGEKDLEGNEHIMGSGGVLASMIELVSHSESLAYSAMKQGADPRRAPALLLWLTEERKGRFFDALSFSAGAKTGGGKKLLAELRQARTKRAEHYLAHLPQHAPSTEEL